MTRDYHFRHDRRELPSTIEAVAPAPASLEINGQVKIGGDRARFTQR